MSRLYRMNDAKPCGAMPVTYDDARYWNERGFGIYWTVNRFRGPRRIENLERVDAWAVDMDAGSKDEQRARIQDCPLVPSLVVETKRGHQVYWKAKDGRAEHWNGIVVDRLVPYFGADKNARDLARILRVPGFLHLKDPADPFLVLAVWPEQAPDAWPVRGYPVSYTERQMAAAFPVAPELEPAPAPDPGPEAEVRTEGDTFWARVYALDCGAALRRLSGSAAVNGEQYTFKLNASGTSNILVDGKSTSCWIDKDGRIGSLSGGGPSIYQWLRWFGYGPRRCAEILKATFPELVA